MRHAKHFLTTMAVLLVGIFLAPDAHAQFIGYVSPQTVTKTFTPTVNCAGVGTQTYNVPSVGQTVHFLSYVPIAGTPTTVQAYFQAVDPTNLAVFQISDIGSDPINGGIVTANGTYARVQIVVNCSGPGTVSVSYFGTSSNSVPSTGLQDQTAYKRLLAYKQDTTSTKTFQVLTPYGNTCGVLQFTYETAIAASTIQVDIAPEGPLSPSGTNQSVLAPTALPNSTTTQFISIPCQPTTKATVTFTTGGAGGSYDLTYLFLKPGVSSGSAVGANVNVAQFGGAGVSLGQKTMAQSMPIVVASDQSAIPVTLGGSGGGVAVVQPATTFNSETTSAVNTAITVSIASGGGSTRVYLYGITARCSAGTASITIKDGVGGTTIWTSDSGFVGTSSASIAWTSAPLASSAANGMDIVLGTCGGGNTGTLDVQASRL